MQLLVDCNNFFASCETLFEPKFRKCPLVVASNNDGCVIARSKEARALGIPMGARIFEYRHLFVKHDVIIRSPNFSLYSDISARIMSIVSDFGYEAEINSIDEAYLSLPKSADFERIANSLKKRIEMWVGIPVSIGVAPSKTLTKIAASIAKQNSGVYIAKTPEDLPLNSWPIGDVWGIGRKLSEKLKGFGIQTATDFTKKNPSWVKKHFHLFGTRTYMELKGVACIPIDMSTTKKSISQTRTFTPEITDREELLATLHTFTAAVCKKLRGQGSLASHITIFLATNRFRKENFRQKSWDFALPEASSYTPDFLSIVSHCFKKIYTEGTSYKRAGVILMNLSNESATQTDAFAKPKKSLENQKKIMQLTDAMNDRYGKNTLFFASEGKKRARKNISPRYTSSWKEIPTVK